MTPEDRRYRYVAGYRYIRSYWARARGSRRQDLPSLRRTSLWEERDGKMRRVGTIRDHELSPAVRDDLVHRFLRGESIPEVIR